MVADSNTVRAHFLPQNYMKMWMSAKGDPYVFHKRRHPVHSQWMDAKEVSTASICHSPHLYKSEKGESHCVNNFDSFMGQLFESDLRQAINELLTIPNCEFVPDKVRLVISLFLSFQLGRGNNMKFFAEKTKEIALNNHHHLKLRPTDILIQNLCKDYLQKKGMEPYAELETHFSGSDFDPFLSSILWNGIIFGNTFFFSDWLLQKTLPGVITADHPVFFHGSTLKESYIVVPLSPTHYLVVDEMIKGENIASFAPTHCPLPLFTAFDDELRTVMNRRFEESRQNRFIIGNDIASFSKD